MPSAEAAAEAERSASAAVEAADGRRWTPGGSAVRRGPLQATT